MRAATQSLMITIWLLTTLFTLPDARKNKLNLEVLFSVRSLETYLNTLALLSQNPEPYVLSSIKHPILLKAEWRVQEPPHLGCLPQKLHAKMSGLHLFDKQGLQEALLSPLENHHLLFSQVFLSL